MQRNIAVVCSRVLFRSWSAVEGDVSCKCRVLFHRFLSLCASRKRSRRNYRSSLLAVESGDDRVKVAVPSRPQQSTDKDSHTRARTMRTTREDSLLTSPLQHMCDVFRADLCCARWLVSRASSAGHTQSHFGFAPVTGDWCAEAACLTVVPARPGTRSRGRDCASSTLRFRRTYRMQTVL